MHCLESQMYDLASYVRERVSVRGDSHNNNDSAMQYLHSNQFHNCKVAYRK